MGCNDDKGPQHDSIHDTNAAFANTWGRVRKALARQRHTTPNELKLKQASDGMWDMDQGGADFDSFGSFNDGGSSFQTAPESQGGAAGVRRGCSAQAQPQRTPARPDGTPRQHDSVRGAMIRIDLRS